MLTLSNLNLGDAVTLAFFQGFSIWHMVIMGIVLLLLFGRRLPEVGKSLGQGIQEFKKGLREVTDDSLSQDAPPPQASQPPYQPYQQQQAPQRPQAYMSAPEAPQQPAPRLQPPRQAAPGQGYQPARTSRSDLVD
jgi:sec-independent protein translocase protein TatA